MDWEQNRRFGWNTTILNVYKADFIVDNNIYVGEDVTEITDFKPAIFESNSNTLLRAGNEIFLESGFEVKPGAEFYAHIQNNDCLGERPESTYPIRQNKKDQSISQMLNTGLMEKNEYFNVYPNPVSNGMTFDIQLHDNHLDAVQRIDIFDINGKQIESIPCSSETGQYQLQGLSKGVYIINDFGPNLSVSKKLIVL